MDSGLVKVLRSCRRVYEQEHQHLSGADLEKGWKQYWNSIGAEVTGNFDSSKLANTANPLKRRASDVGRTSATKTLIRHGTGGQSPADAEIKALIRKGQQLHLPLMVEGEEYEAIPDTGCRVNIVHISVLVKAWKKGGRVTRSPQPLQSLSLRIANGDCRSQRAVLSPMCLPWSSIGSSATTILRSEATLLQNQFFDGDGVFGPLSAFDRE